MNLFSLVRDVFSPSNLPSYTLLMEYDDGTGGDPSLSTQGFESFEAGAQHLHQMALKHWDEMVGSAPIPADRTAAVEMFYDHMMPGNSFALYASDVDMMSEAFVQLPRWSYGNERPAID